MESNKPFSFVPFATLKHCALLDEHDRIICTINAVGAVNIRESDIDFGKLLDKADLLAVEIDRVQQEIKHQMARA